jgi:hypothetical protein
MKQWRVKMAASHVHLSSIADIFAEAGFDIGNKYSSADGRSMSVIVKNSSEHAMTVFRLKYSMAMDGIEVESA